MRRDTRQDSNPDRPIPDLVSFFLNQCAYSEVGIGSTFQ